MAKILVIQHSPYEPLGILVNTLKQRKIRLKYINFYRNPSQKICLTGYDGLVILGGVMNPDEMADYPHLAYEVDILATAIAKDIPILGICLGSQLLNLALGGECYRMDNAEYGWVDVYKNTQKNYKVFDDFDKTTRVFQWHQYASKLNDDTDVLLENKQCVQAFGFKERFIGLQFHLEIDERLHSRWLLHPDYLTHLKSQLDLDEIQAIRKDSINALPQSIKRGRLFFEKFSSLFVKKKHALKSMHAGR